MKSLLLLFSGKCLKLYTENFLTAFQFTKQGVDTAYLDLLVNIAPLYCSFYRWSYYVCQHSKIKFITASFGKVIRQIPEFPRLSNCNILDLLIKKSK